MQQFAHLTPPTEGAAITRRGGELVVPDAPIVPFIEGDGTGPDIWKASVRVFDAAVAKAFGGKKKIVWFEVPAGEKAKAQYGEWLPNDADETYIKSLMSPVYERGKMANWIAPPLKGINGLPGDFEYVKLP